MLGGCEHELFIILYVSPKDEDHRRDPSPDRSDLGEDRGRKARYRKGPHTGLMQCLCETDNLLIICTYLTGEF